jgi:hypothetical protein
VEGLDDVAKTWRAHTANIAHSLELVYIFCMVSSDVQDELDELVEEAIVDAYDELEQRAGLYAMLEDNLGFPFPAKIVGEKVAVTELDMMSEGRILAVCDNKGKAYRVDILDLEIDDQEVTGSQWLAAYRRWASYE